MTEQRQRLFFALWPDESTRQQIDAVAQQLDDHLGKRVAANNLHITLAFIGGSSAEQRACYSQAAEAIKASSFTLKLDSFGYWNKPRVAWLGCSIIPPALNQLVENLNNVLTVCGFEPDQRRYEPHVTLLRKAQGVHEPKHFRPLQWTVDRFCLIESVSRPEGVQYQVLREWFF